MVVGGGSGRGWNGNSALSDSKGKAVNLKGKAKLFPLRGHVGAKAACFRTIQPEPYILLSWKVSALAIRG